MLGDEIARIVAEYPIGRPGAVRRGGNPKWPYIALLVDYLGREGATHNPCGHRAFATRDEAVAAAAAHIDAFRAKLAFCLAEPRMRALRESYGLPREIGSVVKAKEGLNDG